MRVSLAASALFALVMVGPTAGGDAKKDLELLSGSWRIVAMEGGGGLPKEGEPIVYLFKGDSVFLSTNGEELPLGKVKLDPTKKPKAIDIDPGETPDKRKPFEGIYKIEGDTLTVCGGEIGPGRPTEFKSKENSHAVWTAKKVK